MTLSDPLHCLTRPHQTPGLQPNVRHTKANLGALQVGWPTDPASLDTGLSLLKPARPRQALQGCRVADLGVGRGMLLPLSWFTGPSNEGTLALCGELLWDQAVPEWSSWGAGWGGGGPVHWGWGVSAQAPAFLNQTLTGPRDSVNFKTAVGTTDGPLGQGRERPTGEGKKLERFPNAMPTPHSSVRTPGAMRPTLPPFPKLDQPATSSAQSQADSRAGARLLSSYRFNRSPFKELISDLSSLMFWDSRIQLVDVVA